MNDNLTPAQRYYQRHKEARRAYGREYYLKNRDKILARAEERRAERDEEEYIANYVAERNGGGYMESDPVIQMENRHSAIRLVIEPEETETLKVSGDMPIEKIVPVAPSPLDAYRGRGVHNKIPARSKNVCSSSIKVSGPVVVSFS